jgi:maleylpyruvate isomerase
MGRGHLDSPIVTNTDRPAIDAVQRWWADGEAVVAGHVDRLTDADLAADSGLPGWSRGHVVAHLARNADALVNLLTWARTGVETPMYPSQEARDAGIAETSQLPPDRLRGELLAATGRLVEAVGHMSDADWSAQVRSNQGRVVPASEVPWMRCREVWVHAVDLDAGVGFEDIPPDVQAALVDDVFGMWGHRDAVPDVVLFAGDREWGSGSVAVSGPLTAATAWLTGRGTGEGLTADGPLPTLPAWL